MGRRRIGQEKLGFAGTRGDRRSFLDNLEGLIDWAPVERRLAVIPCSAKGESRPGHRWLCCARC
jgi:hypothetical protein